MTAEKPRRTRVKKSTPPRGRVLAYVAYVGECWEWIGAIDRSTGYGRVTAYSVSRSAHRFSYESFIGPIPEGLQLDHLCRNRRCVRPEHLEPVTAARNVHRSPITAATLNAAKRECKSGHPFDRANTYVDRRGCRHCKTCRREGIARLRARQALAAANIRSAAA